MQKISQVLIDSEGVRKQIKTKLVSLGKDGKPEGYCALGALACEKDMFKDKVDETECNFQTPYESILVSYGIVNPMSLVKHPLNDWEEPLLDLIFTLNDGGMSFKEIGEHLKKLEDEGVIKYEN